MKKANWMSGFATLAVGLLAVAAVASAQQTTRGGAARPSGCAVGDHMTAGRDIPGPIDSLQDLQDTGKMLFKMADANNDGQISQKEAVDAGNLLVGGFFFRADADGNGTVTPEEARAVRDTFLSQKPLLRAILKEVRREQQAGQAVQAAGTNPIQSIATLLDGNSDQQIQATELRQAVQTGVQTLFQTADTNRDGQLSPSELNAAMAGMARSAAQTAFQAADADGNGALSREEFDKAIVKPANIIFGAADANNDGQLTPEEAQAARRMIMSQFRMLRVPEPANSASHLIETGRTPEQAAPVPNFGTPTRRAPAPAPAPAPGDQPR